MDLTSKNMKFCQEPKGMPVAHSVPVPRLYKGAAVVLKRYCNKEGSLKSLVYEAEVKCDVRRLFAILSKTISNYSSIESALNNIKLFQEQPKFNQHLAFILTSELLTKGGPLPGTSKPILVINTYEKKLKKLLKSCKTNSVKAESPKYGRINLLICSEDEVHYELNKLGFVIWDYDPNKTTYDEFLKYIQDLNEYSYLKDYHIPHLLVFHPRQKFQKMELYKEHIILLQDKASCLPVFVSGIKPGDVVMDACAAPGNKTSHLATLMGNKGRLIAVDKDSKRFGILQKFLSQRGVTCTETVNEDFTSLNPADYEDVRFILVDPSCSSSGTSVHQDHLSEERIKRLSFFQLRVLTHALTFPNVKTVVYSTCSTDEKENEQVVERALSMCDSTFHLEDLSRNFTNWKHFGSNEYQCGCFCLRTNSTIDQCQGFFVAKFVRKGVDTAKTNSSKKERKRKEKSEGEIEIKETPTKRKKKKKSSSSKLHQIIKGMNKEF